MSAVLVAVPVIKDSRRFHLEKGRRWTVVEHILLEAIAKKDWSVTDLTIASNLPRRVVLEVIIRLMRAGWVELKSQSAGVIFSTTSRGRVYATREDLPPVTHSTARYMGYVVELFSGAVFKARDLVTLNQDQWHKRRLGRTFAEVPERLSQHDALPDIRILADRLLESDEHLTRVDVQDWRPRRLYGLVSVRNDKIEGLGGMVPDDLQAAILAAAKSAGRTASPAVYPVPRHDGRMLNQQPNLNHQISFRSDDLIVGGPSHEQALQSALSRARHRVIIHSTFISDERAREVLKWMEEPAQKGAIVDILWGQSKEKNGLNATRQAALMFNEMVTQKGLQERIRIHMTSTRSHAKLILSDAGDPEKFTAIIGSCNWLYSDFGSLDTSVRLREAGIVADIAFNLAELVRPRDGQIPDLSVELLRLGRSLLADPRPNTGKGTVRIVSAPEHARVLTDAREEAKERVLLLSHRLDVGAKPALIKLGSTAQNDGPERLEAFFDRLGDSVTPKSAEELCQWALTRGVVLKHRHKTHGKALAWDADNLLVTSLNMLSADPDEREPRQELGVLIRASGAAKALYAAVEHESRSVIMK